MPQIKKYFEIVAELKRVAGTQLNKTDTNYTDYKKLNDILK